MNIAANAMALFAQMFLVKQVVTRFGIGRSLFLFPLVSIIGFVVLAMEPTLMVVAILDVVRRASASALPSRPRTCFIRS